MTDISFSTPDTPKLQRRLHRWGLWLRLVESLSWGSWGLTAGLTLAAVIALAARALPLFTARELATRTVLLALVGVVLGQAAAWLYPRPIRRLARLLDHRLALAERLTTALEIAAGRVATPPALAALQQADTLAAASRADIRAAIPPRLPRLSLLISAALAIALAALLWLPNPQEDVLHQQAAVHAAVEEQVAALEAAREEVLQAESLTEAERQALLQALEEALAALGEERATPADVIAALSQAEQALAPLNDPGAASLQAALQRAAQEMDDAPVASELVAALAQGNYRAAAEELVALAGDEGRQLTREEELELARALAQAAAALRESDPALAQQFDAAAAAIEQGDMAQAREAIRQAAGELGQAGQRVERQQTVEQTLAVLQQGREQVAQAGGT